MRISDWSSDVCSSDLSTHPCGAGSCPTGRAAPAAGRSGPPSSDAACRAVSSSDHADVKLINRPCEESQLTKQSPAIGKAGRLVEIASPGFRSEEHPSTSQSLIRTSYAGFRLKKNSKYT